MYQIIHTDDKGNAWFDNTSFFLFEDAHQWVLRPGRDAKPRTLEERESLFILDVRRMQVYSVTEDGEIYCESDHSKYRHTLDA